VPSAAEAIAPPEAVTLPQKNLPQPFSPQQQGAPNAIFANAEATAIPHNLSAAATHLDGFGAPKN
jgi:hypothetical protein